MSHFTEVKVAFKQESEKDLIAALEQEFGEGTVEVHEEGAALFGYKGDNRAKKKESDPNYAPPCHLIIRRGDVGSASNDVGYRRTEDGKYVAYISDYDQGGNFNQTKQNKVAQEYAARVSERKLKAQGYNVTRRLGTNGRILVEGSKYR